MYIVYRTLSNVLFGVGKSNVVLSVIVIREAHDERSTNLFLLATPDNSVRLLRKTKKKVFVYDKPALELYRSRLPLQQQGKTKKLCNSKAYTSTLFTASIRMSYRIGI